MIDMMHIGRNIVSLIFSRVLAGVILFLIYTRLAQYLGPEAAGQFGILSIYLTVFSIFIDLGMSQLVIKKMSEDKSNVQKYLSNYLVVQFFLGLIFMLLMDLVVLLSGYPQNVKQALYVAGFGLLLSSMSLPLRSVINAFQRLTIIAKVNFANSVINATFMVLAIVLQKHIFFLAFISVAVSVFDIIIYGLVVNKNFSRFKIEMDWPFIKSLFVMAAPFTLLTIFSVYNRVDSILLSYFRDFVEVGYYSAAYKFWDTLAFLPNVIAISLYPFFAERISRGIYNEVKKGLEAYTRYMVALALPLAVGAFALAKPITLAFYGSDFLPAANALWLLVASVSVLMIYTPVNSLIISQMTKTATKITGFNFAFNISLNLLLIPKFGFIAAAAITLVSETIQWLFYSYQVKRKIVDFILFKNFLKPLLAAAVMGLVIFFLQDRNIWLVILSGALSYASALLALRYFIVEDWELLKASVNVTKSINAEDQV